MPFNPKPSDHIAGISVSGNNLVIPLASIPDITSAEVVDATGDIRKVAYAIALKLYSVYVSMASEDRPTKWIAVRNTQAQEDSETATRALNFSFTINNPLNTATETEVTSEN